MRKLKTPIVLLGMTAASSLFVSTAWAQTETDATDDPTAPTADDTADPAEPPAASEPEPEAVEPEPVEDEMEEPAGPAETPAPAPAASASASASTGGGVGAIVQMGDSGDGPSTRGAGAGGGGGGITTFGGPTSSEGDEWKFGFNGYFRAPMRVGMGERINAKTDQSKTTLSTPQIPNDQYLDWQYTKSVPRSWLESYFSYGNSWAKGVFGLQAFRFSDASWADPEAQFGVGQGWVELTPDMGSIDENMRLTAKVGAFSSRYGGAGQYDAGGYDTYIIGRTHQMGQTVRVEYDYDDMMFFFEEGFGTKQPNPNPFHNTKFTLLAHAHAGFSWDQFLSVGVHIMHAWTQEPDHDCQSREEEVAFNEAGQGAQIEDSPLVQRLVAEFAEGPVGACKHEATDGSDDRLVADGVSVPRPAGAQGNLVRRSDTPDGSLTVVGLDAVLTPGVLGRFFLGVSRIMASHAVTVAPAFEVIHANGGGFFKSGVTHQFFNEKSRWDNHAVASRGGSGHIDTIEAQWNLSLSSLIGSEVFGGHTLDLETFFMLNMITVDADSIDEGVDDPNMDGVSKMKFGGDLSWHPTGWFGLGLRGDRVQPRSDLPEQSFTVLAPRAIFRSSYTSHERINIGYARYIYAQRECGSDFLRCVQAPGATVAPDGFGNRPGINATKMFRGTPVDVESGAGPFNASPNAIQSWDPPHENVFFVSADIWW